MTFDAELYLRLAGERTLLGSGRSWLQGGLRDAADALFAVGAVDLDVAQQVVDDYTFAVALRQDGHAHHALNRSAYRSHAGNTARVLAQRRLVPCDTLMELGDDELHVRYVSLAEDETRVGVTLRRRPGRRRSRAHAFMHGGGGPSNLTLTDEHGTTAAAHFSGGGSESEWEGRFSTHQPLARDTRWIEIDGKRIELVDRPLSVDVRVESLGESDDGLRHLWHRVATTDHFHRGGDSVEAAIAALVAAGHVDVDDPRLTDVRAVGEALSQGGRPARRRDLPEPWTSLFARGRRAKGPVGRIAVGGVTPEFDGFCVALMSIDSTSEGFSAEIEQSGGRGGFSPFETEVGVGRLVWWAEDDRGNRYLGRLGRWGGGLDHGEGNIEFWPALDREATSLSVIPTSETTRCVITFPLAWEPA